jgi:hypothetical protein
MYQVFMKYYAELSFNKVLKASPKEFWDDTTTYETYLLIENAEAISEQIKKDMEQGDKKPSSKFDGVKDDPQMLAVYNQLRK